MGRFIAILSSLSLCLLLSCSNNEQNDVTNQPYLSNFSNSGCKQYISGATSATNSPSGKVATTTNDLPDEQIRLLTNDNKRLQIIHENTILSCNAVIETGFKVVGSTIILTEKSTMDTNCICHYDLSFTIDNLENGEYKIIIMRQYIDRTGKILSDGVKYCDFSITLTDNLSQNTKI